MPPTHPNGSSKQTAVPGSQFPSISNPDAIGQSSIANLGLSSEQQRLLAFEQNQLRLQQYSQMGNGQGLFGLTAGQNTGLGSLGAVGSLNDRLLLQLLAERQRQQDIQRQALAHELAEREYERNLLHRLGGMGGLGSLGYQGLTSMGVAGLADGAFSRLQQHQTQLSSLLGGQVPSTILQNTGTLGANGLAAQGLVPGQHAPAPFGFDDSITLETRSKQAFPLKLYRMLERAERNGQEDIISFIDGGKAFAIHKPRAFETDIMPSYFNSHRMSSFQRQLNIYGFERINDGIQKGAYRHKYFIKGKKELLEKIKRPQKLRHGGALLSEPDEEDEVAKLQSMAAEHLVGLSRSSGGDSSKTKADVNCEKDDKTKEEK